MAQQSNPRQKFQNYVTQSLAAHTVKLENIEKTLDRLHTDLPAESRRVGSLEQKFQFFKGITWFMMGMLGVFVALVGVLK
tara:strand:- start:65 stop:304 length:240 start_codon:yes stop_codon:yes gene_type:complete